MSDIAAYVQLFQAEQQGIQVHSMWRFVINGRLPRNDLSQQNIDHIKCR